MAQDSVIVRQVDTEAEPAWTESVVGPSLLRSAPARVVRRGDNYHIEGAAWRAPIRCVDVQIDNGPMSVLGDDSDRGKCEALVAFHFEV